MASEIVRFEPPRGMRDFYPADMDIRNGIFTAWTTAAREFGFSQYDACVVESLELLKRKSGEEIVDQIYAFKDKSDRDLALRPEMTPSLARMIVARQGVLTFPLKWFALAQCFRYERMTRGRKREHYQWNLDVVGEPSMSAETEVLACAIRALDLLGLGADDVVVHFSSRALLADLLLKSGIPQAHHAATFLALDKRGKIEESVIQQMLKDSGIDQPGIDAIFRLASIRSLEEAQAVLSEPTPSLDDVYRLLTRLDLYGIRDRVVFDIGVVRGLGYYTGVVFEAFDVDRKFRAIFGGGRYDRLLQDVGGTAQPAVGLGFGDVVIAELLAEKGKLTNLQSMIDVAVGYMDEGQSETALRVARHFRKTGCKVDLALRREKPKAFFARVGRGDVKKAVYIGPDDVTRGTVRLKQLIDRTEEELVLAAI